MWTLPHAALIASVVVYCIATRGLCLIASVVVYCIATRGPVLDYLSFYRQ